jgi:hypothetical protein
MSKDVDALDEVSVTTIRDTLPPDVTILHKPDGGTVFSLTPPQI